MQYKWNLRLLALLFLLVCSVLINVFQTRKIRQLRSNMAIIKSEGRLASGTEVPAIEGRDVSGAFVSLHYEDSAKPTVLYVFSPQCVWCERNMENVKTLIAQSSDKYRYIGLSITRDKLEEYLNSHEYGIPIYTDLSGNVKSTYKFGGTPQTIVVSTDGKVVRNWTGAYSGSLEQEIEQYFGVALPGFTEAKE